jgi:hypothetical protein
MDYNARKEHVLRDIYDQAFRGLGLINWAPRHHRGRPAERQQTAVWQFAGESGRSQDPTGHVVAVGNQPEPHCSLAM